MVCPFFHAGDFRMPRIPKPWYRKDRDAWFVTIAGTRHNLGSKKKEAMARFYELMREPTFKQVSSQSVVAIADAFLDWLKQVCKGTHHYSMPKFTPISDSPAHLLTSTFQSKSWPVERSAKPVTTCHPVRSKRLWSDSFIALLPNLTAVRTTRLCRK